MSYVKLKDPSAVLDYGVDWSTWLPSGDTISSSSWSVVPSGELAVDSDNNTTSATSATVSGGDRGKTYRLVNQIVTAEGRTEERSVVILVANR